MSINNLTKPKAAVNLVNQRMLIIYYNNFLMLSNIPLSKGTNAVIVNVLV